MMTIRRDANPNKDKEITTTRKAPEIVIKTVGIVTTVKTAGIIEILENTESIVTIEIAETSETIAIVATTGTIESAETIESTGMAIGIIESDGDPQTGRVGKSAAPVHKREHAVVDRQKARIGNNKKEVNQKLYFV
jgi:hypothetical protein